MAEKNGNCQRSIPSESGHSETSNFPEKIATIFKGHNFPSEKSLWPFLLSKYMQRNFQKMGEGTGKHCLWRKAGEGFWAAPVTEKTASSPHYQVEKKTEASCGKGPWSLWCPGYEITLVPKLLTNVCWSLANATVCCGVSCWHLLLMPNITQTSAPHIIQICALCVLLNTCPGPKPGIGQCCPQHVGDLLLR